jgi:hypothetical protein
MPNFMIQPASFIDQMKDGHEMTKRPYPFFVDAMGLVGNQDFWQGSVVRVAGFQKDLAVQQIDLRWKDAMKDPGKAVGMYLVTVDSKGNYGVHNTAMETVEEVTV